MTRLNDTNLLPILMKEYLQKNNKLVVLQLLTFVIIIRTFVVPAHFYILNFLRNCFMCEYLRPKK